ncbi:MAG: hypothetical protein VCC00_15010 [Deltaproteobacteria bacterium]
MPGKEAHGWRIRNVSSHAGRESDTQRFDMSPKITASSRPATSAVKKPAPRPRFLLDRSLTDYAYRCWPNGCPRGFTCCVGLTIELSAREVRAIDTVMDEVAERIPALRAADGTYENVFVDDPPELIIEAHEDGSCPFLCRTSKSSLCSIHSIALETGREIKSVKPGACRHWPVMLEQAGGSIRVRLQPVAEKIGCIVPRAEMPQNPTVLEAYREEIEEMCGATIVPQLTRRLRAVARADRRRKS